MNKNIIIGLLVLLVLGVVGYFVYMSMQTAPATTTTPSETVQQDTPVTGSPSETGQTESASIEIKNFNYTPNTVVVMPGETITVTNRDIVNHTVTSDQDGLFDSGLVGRDQSMTITAPITPGEYSYHCTPHPFMKGTIVVK